jgi:hypothetical protein
MPKLAFPASLRRRSNHRRGSLGFCCVTLHADLLRRRSRFPLASAYPLNDRSSKRFALPFLEGSRLLGTRPFSAIPLQAA